MLRVSACALSLTAALAVSGCERTPTEPTTAAKTETFNGTLIQQGTISHPFTVQEGGQVTISVLSLTRQTPEGSETEGPETPESLPPIYIGMGIGTWDGSVCSVIAHNTSSSLLTTIAGTTTAGNFCVSIFDPGVVTTPVDYVVQVVHT